VADFDTVAFDIEVTGFATDDQLTVVEFDAEAGTHIFLNTGGRECGRSRLKG